MKRCPFCTSSMTIEHADGSLHCMHCLTISHEKTLKGYAAAFFDLKE